MLPRRERLVGSNQRELDGLRAAEQAKAHPRSDAIVEALERYTGQTFQSGDDAMRALLATLEAAPLSAGLHEAVLGPERCRQMTEGVTALIQGTRATEDRKTIGAHVTGWLDVLRAGVSNGQLSAGRWDAYGRNIKHFTAWIGADADVATINAPKLEAFYGFLTTRVAEGKWTPATATGIFMTARQFIRRLAELGLIPLPGNISSRRFRFGNGATAVETVADGELKALFAAASERMKLYLLLMLNCGMYQNDVAELAVTEVDWAAGKITRKRSKTRDRKDAPTVCYKLWPETFRLLAENRAEIAVSNDRGGTRVLLTAGGKPLVFAGVKDGKHTGYDAIQSSYQRLQEKWGVKKPLKCLRRTAASKLGSHPEYGAYTQHFLAHAPKGMTDRHYVKPDQAKFDEALDWLRRQFDF